MQQPFILSSNVYAAAGSTQASATRIETDFVVVTSGTGGVRLPQEQRGNKVLVRNSTGSAVNVYPPTDGQINALADNVPYSLAAGTARSFTSVTRTDDTTDWITEQVLSADIVDLNSANHAWTGTNTWAGTSTFNGTTTATDAFAINGAANSIRDLYYKSAGTLRWLIRTDGATESGANAGSNFSIRARADDGSDLGAAIYIARASQQVTFSATPLVGATPVSLVGHTHAAADVTSGVFNTARLGSGTANSGVFLRGDSTWTNEIANTFRISNASALIQGLNDAGWIGWYNTAGSTRSGYIQYVVSDATYLVNENAGNRFIFLASGEKLRIDTNATHVTGQVRATGWYGSNAAVSGPAAEVGYSGGLAYFLGYDRTGGSYQPVSLQGSDVRLDGAIAGASGQLRHANFGTSSTKEWRFAGTSTNFYVFYGANEDVYLRAGKTNGTVYIGNATNDYVTVSNSNFGVGVPATISTGTSMPLRLQTSNSGPWALDLYRTDYGAGSKVFNHKYDGTNMGWAFEHGIYAPAFRDTNGSVAKIVGPTSNGTTNYWHMYGGTTSTVALRLLDSAGNGGTWLYASGSDYGILNGSGSWGLRYNSSNAAWESAIGNSEFAANGFRYLGSYSYYIYNTSGYSYGSWRIGGTRGGYVGLVLDGTKSQTLMSDGTNVGLYNQADGRWSFYTPGDGNVRIYGAGSYYINFFADSGWTNCSTNSAAWYFDRDTHVNGQVKKYLEGAHLYYTSSSNATGKITVSTSAASGTPADGELWFQRAA